MASPTSGPNAGVRAFSMLLVGMASTTVIIGIVLAVFTSRPGMRHPLHGDVPVLAIVLALWGVACMIGARIVERPLDPTTDASLLASYRTRFFVWVWFGECPLFASILLLVLSGAMWLYVIGLVPAVIAYVRLAPTEAHLARDQAAVNRSGHPRSVKAALASITPTPRRFG